MASDQPELNPQGRSVAWSDGEPPSSEAQVLFLERLRTLLERRRGTATEKLNEHELRAVDRAIYSTYCDCLQLGVGTEARQLLQQLRHG